MELIILGAILLIWLIFVYEFIQSNPKNKKSSSKILTADEVISTQDEIKRARSILKNIKSPEGQKEPEKAQDKEEILPDPFSDQKN